MKSIGLCMIVKNEARVITRCLESVRPLIDHVLIEDTGSSDGTQEIIRGWLTRHNLAGEVIEEPWRDFGYNRTHAMEALRKVGSVDYALIIDADDTLEIDAGFDARAFKSQMSHDLYDVPVRHGGIAHHRPQLLSNRLPFSFKGVVHEYLEAPPGPLSRDTAKGFAIRATTAGARSANPRKYQDDAAVLERALATETDPFRISRYTFYLAQSYRDCGEKEKALHAYLKRAELGFWTEEVYVSLYSAAKLQQDLQCPFDEVMATYRRAANAAPRRAEALHGASRYCRLSQRYKEGYEIAKRANLSAEAPDGLFVEPWINEYGLLDELAVNAYWAGAYQDCLDACERILREGKCPEAMRPRVEANAAFARQQLAGGARMLASFLSKVSGIIHVGANHGQERETYASHDLPVVWVEALPDVCALLKQNLNNFPKQRAVQALVTDQVGQKYTFHVSNNSGASSSIYDFALHQKLWPDVKFTHHVELDSTTLDQIALETKIDLSRVDALVMDTQGSELLVLKGADRLLRHLRYIMTEAADFELYLGSTRAAELTAYLSEHNFRLVVQESFAEHPAVGRCYNLLFERDTEMLEKALLLEQNPLIRSRYIFYLAQSYRDARQPDKALPLFLKRATLGYWTDEVFISLFEAARIQESMGASFEEVVRAYLRASDSASHRAEALHAAGRLCRLKNKFAEGYEYARRGLAIEKPADGLFVEAWIYDYGLIDEFAVNAYWIERYGDCLEACERLLREGKMPQDMHDRVKKNAQFAAEKMRLQGASCRPTTKPIEAKPVWISASGTVHSTMKFFSQCGQDRFLYEHFFRGKRDGIFVDVGAYDGEKFSNSLFFERFMGWRGLCIEPLPSAFAKLSSMRKAICEQVFVADFEGEADFVESDAGIDEKMRSRLAAGFDTRRTERLRTAASNTMNRRVQVTKLSSLLAKYSLFHVDYCSIDIDGSELKVVSELDLERFHISVLTIGNDYDVQDLPKLMAQKGYDFVAKLEQDYVFKRRNVKRLPQTSVLCAVWHQNPQRIELLRRHSANLARQTVPVEPIYVFDGDDEPPGWLKGRAISVREALTIYQAWNVALSLVDTPFVMNLNLDDRLCHDTVELMEGALGRDGEALIVGGEWKICYSQGETDEIDWSYPADRLPFLSTWPPLPGTKTRLGSGTGERGTLGPATMWRMEAHLGVPRYPWRLSDGTLLRSAADLGFWRIITNHLNRKTLRLPIVIGNYHSHPQDQAEFRQLPNNELQLMADPGVSVL